MVDFVGDIGIGYAQIRGRDNQPVGRGTDETQRIQAANS